MLVVKCVDGDGSENQDQSFRLAIYLYSLPSFTLRGFGQHFQRGEMIGKRDVNDQKR